MKEESRISISNRLFINEIKEIPETKYKIKNLLGVGSFGRVFLAQNIYTLEYIAMKEIPTLGRATQGVRIMRMSEGDTVASIGIVLPEEENTEEETPVK